MRRLETQFTSGKDTCSAWLYLPESSTPAPILIMAHGLGGVKTMRLDAFAERFSEARYACLVFDYRFFADSGGEPRQLLDINEQLKDWKSAVEFIQNNNDAEADNIDKSQIILWGTSFSGGHVLKTAAIVPGIAGVISQCPFTDGLASSLALHPLSALKSGALAMTDLLSSPFRSEPVMIKLAAAKGQAGLMTADDVISGYEALKPESGDIPDYVAARFALNIIQYYPGKSAKNIQVPTLLVACLKDTVAPVGKTLKYAKQLPDGEVVELDAGHFDIYVGEWFEKNTAIQLDWLERHFPLPS